MTTTNIEHLGRRIEQLIQDHIVASQRAAADAVSRAFAAAGGRVPRPPPVPRREGGTRRRTPEEITALSDRLYLAVCEHPGERMVVLAVGLGSSVRELDRPMELLQRAGKVRSAGERHLTRYFPMVAKS